MSATEMSSTVINGLTSTFFNFGPFFLAIFAQLYIIAKARTWYSEVCNRTEPLPSTEERETYRYYFLGSMLLSLAVFAIAIWAWWLANVTPEHLYKFEITGLRAEQSVDDPEYFKQENWYRSQAGGASSHSTRFVVDSERPIQNGDTFMVTYNINPALAQANANSGALGSGSASYDLPVRFSGRRFDRFRIATDGNGRPSLVTANSSTVVASAGGGQMAALEPAPGPKGADR
jgi:hypothetical protein